MPYSTLTEPTVQCLARLRAKTITTMHGSVYVGDSSRTLLGLAVVLKEVVGSTS
jgi:hypothetical protein